MKIHIAGRHIKLTTAIKSYVEEKVGKAQKYFDHLIWAQVILSIQKQTHTAEIVIHASRQTFRAQAKGGDLYSAIDLASDKIDTQLRKHKERLREHKNRVSMSHMAEEIIPRAHISVIKQVELKPMSVEDAARQMENLGYNFWLFQEISTRQLQVVFRRLDNTYGLLQPVKRGQTVA
ncbi:MAG: ribosomal subunit interface protein [Elusimicrobia bacterium RIFCSPLOWO2_12_FULL_59_9]|nr:MAG: ribosomal subunit interface protein [Elusimicrobia bacterium RIFCSPLOWO2_12_FULL_59_9]